LKKPTPEDEQISEGSVNPEEAKESEKQNPPPQEYDSYEGYWKDGYEVLCALPTFGLTTYSLFHINSMALDDIGGLTPASTQETGAKGNAVGKAFTSGQMYVHCKYDNGANPLHREAAMWVSGRTAIKMGWGLIVGQAVVYTRLVFKSGANNIYFNNREVGKTETKTGGD